MDDLRSEPRNHLVYYLRVFEQDGKTLFGHVVDVSPSGMLITSDRPMQQTGTYQLRVEDARHFETLKTVPVEAECRWCKHDAGLYDGGFKLVKQSKPFRELLEEVV